ncbi:MAG: hypothetical protein ACRDWI_09000 [Jiangellaceae bacterium]
MVSASATPGTEALPARVIAGVAGGLVGGIPLGIIMHARDMMPMVADLIGNTSVGVGWLVHLFNSALFGAIFALLFSRWIAAPGPAMGIGLLYGLAWWVIGALWIMPAWLGMSEMIFEVNADAWWSLVGHLLFGLLLASVYVLVRGRLQPR